VYENGSPAGFSAGVTTVKYYNSTIYQYNGSQWFAWTGTTWGPGISDPRVSPNGFVIPTSGSSIVDSAINTWTLSGGQVYENGTLAGVSSGVTQLLWYNSTIYQFNGTQWFAWNGTAWGSGQGDPRSTSFGMKIVGNTFTDLSSNILTLKGANFSGMENTTNTTPFSGTTQSTWAGIASTWGLNIFRFPVNAHSWLTIPAYKSGVIACINNVTAAGVYAIIDLHWDCPAAYNNGVPVGQPGFISQDNGPSFWTDVANTFKTNPAVLFELMNEPYGIDTITAQYLTYCQQGTGNTFITFWTDQGGNGGLAATGTTYKASGHQPMLNAIRATGATNVCLYSCMAENSYFAQSLACAPTDTTAPTGFSGTWTSQLAATVHYANGSAGNYTTVLNATSSGYPVNLPILMTECYTTTNLGGLNGFIWPNHIGIVLWTPANDGQVGAAYQNWDSNKTNFNGCLTASPYNSQPGGTLDNLQTGVQGTHAQQP